MAIKNPAKLKEKGTSYNFLEFWSPNSHEECFENDGGSFPRIRYLDNLRGLYVECSHWLSRGNSFGQVNLRDLVSYIQKKAGGLCNTNLSDVPEMLVTDWLRRLYGNDKQLRKHIGLDKIDILKGTFFSLSLKEELGVSMDSLEEAINSVSKSPRIRKKIIR
ncbi:MAG: hypothetical protein ABH840_02605 [Nanoarchaeota archaeon]